MSGLTPSTLNTEQVSQTAVESLERQLTLMMRSLEALYRKRAYPLERAHYVLLVTLLEKSPQTLSELANRLALDDSTVTRQVATMERLGLVARLPNPRDGRSFVISASAAGEQAAAGMRATRLARLHDMLNDWSSEEGEALTRLVGKLNQAVTEVLAQIDDETP